MLKTKTDKKYYWQPLSISYLLTNFHVFSVKVLVPILGWVLLIAGSIFISGKLLAVSWLTPVEVIPSRAADFYVIYPIYMMGLLLLFWMGFEWGFIPLFISSFALAFKSGISIGLSLVFSISFIFSLALFGLGYQSLRIPHDLRDFKSISFFISVSFISSLASSMCALIWCLFHELSASDTALVWKGWWTSMFFQSLIIVGPLLFLLTPPIERIKEKYYKVEAVKDVSLAWIYGTVVCVTATLIIFILSGQFLGNYRLGEVLNHLPNIARGEVFGALETFEIIFWLSIGLIIITGSTAMYLVGKWNNRLQQKVDKRTRQLEESREELQRSLNEKKLLLRESHHRIKNSLEQIRALLEMQVRSVGDQAYARLITNATSRIQSMALIHQTLYDTENYSTISLKDYLQRLSIIIDESFGTEETNIDMNFSIRDYILGTRQAITLGLILTEILINAHKYAFEGRKQGTLTIKLDTDKNGMYFLEISDDGIGLPEEPSREASNLGMKLISLLSNQINGDISIESGEGGTRFSLSFPPEKESS